MSTEAILISVIGAFIASIIFMGVDYGLSDPIEATGIIIDKSFIAATHGTTVGTSSNGKVVVGTTSTNDNWSIIVRHGDQIIKVSCSANDYYNSKVGDSFRFNFLYGRFTGVLYDCQSINQ